MKYARSTIQKHRRAWLKELREGGRSQISGMLCKLDEAGQPEGFCCLGVASEMAKVPVSHDYAGHRYYVTYNEGEEYLTLPQAAREWLGVIDADPRLGYLFDEAHEERLRQVLEPRVFEGLMGEATAAGWDMLTPATLNDYGLTFAQIADVIEEFGFHPDVDVLQREAV